jgi:hypothetical protein
MLNAELFRRGTFLNGAAIACCALIFVVYPIQSFGFLAQGSTRAGQQPESPDAGTGTRKDQQPTSSHDELTIYPNRVVPGKNYVITIKSKTCSLTGTKLSVPEDITKMESEVISADGCVMTAKIAIAPEAELETAILRVTDKVGNIKPLEIAVKEKPPGPIPPGLEPQADVMWEVLSKDVVRDNFGRKVANQYYCIEITIGNNTGYDLQIASVAFTVPALAKQAKDLGYTHSYFVPGNNYKITRGTIEWEQRIGPRNFTVNLIKGLGPVLTGFVPYFHELNHRGNFSEAINIFSNPIEKGFELVIPDRTVRNLDRLEDQVIHEGIIVPNNTQAKTYKIFLPRDFLRSIMDEAFAKSLTDKAGAEKVLKSKYRDDPVKVMLQLGQLVLIGDKVQHLNRVQVISRSLTAGPVETPNIALFGDQFVAQGEVKELKFNGSFADDVRATFVNTDSGLEVVETKVSDGGKVLTLRVKANDDATIGSQNVDIQSKGEITRNSVKIEPSAPSDLSLNYVGGEPPSEDPAREQSIQITIKGKHLAGVKDITIVGGAEGKIKATIQPGATTAELPVLVTISPKVTQGNYDLELRNNNRAGTYGKVTLTVLPQPAPDNLTVLYKETGSKREDPPKANQERDQPIVLTIRGDNIDSDTKVIQPLPQATQGKLEIKSQRIKNGNLRADIILKKEAGPGSYPLVVKNRGGGTKEIQFEVAPNQ